MLCWQHQLSNTDYRQFTRLAQCSARGRKKFHKLLKLTPTLTLTLTYYKRIRNKCSNSRMLSNKKKILCLLYFINGQCFFSQHFYCLPLVNRVNLCRIGHVVAALIDQVDQLELPPYITQSYVSTSPLVHRLSTVRPLLVQQHESHVTKVMLQK